MYIKLVSSLINFMVNRMIKKVLVLIGILLVVIYPGVLFADPGFSCIVTKVIDGDTFWVETIRGKLKIRVWGVSSPEVPPKVTTEVAKQNGGLAAKEAMKELLLFKSLSCTPISGSYDRIVCQCFLDGKDIGVHLIETKHGKEDVGYSKHYYKELK